MLKANLFSAVLIFFNTAFIFSQPSIKAVYSETPPHFDGKLNDEVWNRAALINELYQREPKTGEIVSEKTEFFFLFDRNNIYVGIRCGDQPGAITAKEMARDVDLGNDDRVQVILDTYLDGRNGYWFQLGPRGSIGDALISENGKDFNKSWDGLWDGKATLTDTGWEGEMVIPFKTLGFKKGSDTWGLKLIRHIKRKSESSYWPATTLNAARFSVSDAGRIEGLTNITQGIGIDIIPYLTGGLSKKPGSSEELPAETHPVADGGIDAFYQITPSLKAGYN